MSFANKVAIVTGASSGIGAATAVMFCEEGANVTLVGRNEAKLKSTSEKCSAAGGRHIIVKADVSNDADAEMIVRETIDTFGKLDVLVNNAGVLSYGTILDGTVIDAFDKIIPINLRGALKLTVLAAPHLVKTKGNIINITSIAGQVVVKQNFIAYSTAKAGLDYFTRASASELAAEGVRVNAISPGPVDTDIFTASGSSMENELSGIVAPLGRISQCNEIADLIQFLASDKAKGITGSIFVSDNGILVKSLRN